MIHAFAWVGAAVLALAPLSGLAADGMTVETAASPEYGSYLTDSEGRALYLFEADTPGTAAQQPRVSCEGDCLTAWPPLYTEGEPEAGDGVDTALLGTVEHQGRSMVTYGGWPLYYFVRDDGPGDTKGQDVEGFGGEWYLVTPDGEKAGHK